MSQPRSFRFHSTAIFHHSSTHLLVSSHNNPFGGSIILWSSARRTLGIRPGDTHSSLLWLAWYTAKRMELAASTWNDPTVHDKSLRQTKLTPIGIRRNCVVLWSVVRYIEEQKTGLSVSVSVSIVVGWDGTCWQHCLAHSSWEYDVHKQACVGPS